jgi:hypothetical protein
MGWFFRKSKKIAPGVRLNVSKRGLGLSAGVRGARVSANTQGDRYVSGGRGGLYFRKRLKRKTGDREFAPGLEAQARNLEFGAFVLEKAKRQGITEVIPDSLIEDAAAEFFGDAGSPEAKAAIAYVNQD